MNKFSFLRLPRCFEFCTVAHYRYCFCPGCIQKFTSFRMVRAERASVRSVGYSRNYKSSVLQLCFLSPFWNLEFRGGCLSFGKCVESFSIPCFVWLVNRIVSNRQKGRTVCRYVNCRQLCLNTAVTKRVY